MKTLIEFFDANPIENVNALLRYNPDKVVFVGFKNIMNNGRKRALDRFLNIRLGDNKPDIEFVDDILSYDFDGIVYRLEQIVDSNEDCCFDITGGKESVLAAAGIIAERKNIPMFQFNINSGNLFRLKACTDLPDTKTPELSIRECIVLNGGEIIKDEPDDYDWDFQNGFKKDIEYMWSICLNNPWNWNRQMAAFENFVKYGSLSEDYVVSVDREHLRNQGHEHCIIKPIINNLLKRGLILDYSLSDDDKLTFRFKNKQIFMCLTKAGNILELYTYSLLREIEEENPGYYDDIDVGVYVDWDGEIESDNGAPNIMNEIDIILMKDEVPVFISCKNGLVKRDALYELNTMAQHFGNKNSKKILIAVNGDEDSGNETYLFKRANDMGILPVGKEDMVNKEKFKNKLRKITR